jgi:Arc/MetJ-type ribon-helix-helix transcriptional regulator
MVISADVPESLVAKLDALVVKTLKPKMDMAYRKKYGTYKAWEKYLAEMEEYNKNKTKNCNRSEVIRTLLEAALGKSK